MLTAQKNIVIATAFMHTAAIKSSSKCLGIDTLLPVVVWPLLTTQTIQHPQIF